MVRAANAWSKRDLAIAAAAVALQAYATRSGFGGPCALLLLIIAPFVFGRDAWDGETSAYSVFNGGRRIAGTFTAEQFDAVTKRFVFDINPFIRSPYTGEKLGEFILEKLMPEYQDAIERIEEQLREAGMCRRRRGHVERARLLRVHEHVA